MPNAFVFSAGNSTARKHYADTVESGVPLTRILPLIADLAVREKLVSAYGDSGAYCWGGKSGGQDDIYVNAMTTGDLIMGYRERAIICAAYFVVQTKNRQLGLSLWPDATDPPFDLVYFFTEPQFLNQNIASLEYFASVYQGLRRLPSSPKILDDYGSFSNFVRQALGGTADTVATAEDGSLLASLGEEGRRRLRLHWSIERDQSNTKKVKQRWTQQDPLLRCECCNFSFAEVYGIIGKGFIEAHHRTPLKDLKGRVVQPVFGDFAPVCANCHRMLHRPNVTIDDLKKLSQSCPTT